MLRKHKQHTVAKGMQAFKHRCPWPSSIMRKKGAPFVLIKNGASCAHSVQCRSCSASCLCNGKLIWHANCLRLSSQGLSSSFKQTLILHKTLASLPLARILHNSAKKTFVTRRGSQALCRFPTQVKGTRLAQRPRQNASPALCALSRHAACGHRAGGCCASWPPKASSRHHLQRP